MSAFFPIFKVVDRPQNIQCLTLFHHDIAIATKSADSSVHVSPITQNTNNSHAVDNPSVIYAFNDKLNTFLWKVGSRIE